MKKWEVKKGKKEFKTALGETDYDIPMFGYKSSFIIVGGLFISTLLIVYISEILKINKIYGITFILPLIIGFLVGFSQNFIERKKGFSSSFFITVIIISLLFYILFYLVFFKNIII